MEDGLVPDVLDNTTNKVIASLNPCCDGRWSRTKVARVANKFSNLS